MDDIKTKLEHELQNVRGELGRLDQQLQERGDYGFGKGDPGIYQWEFNLALRERYRQHLEQIENALQRIQDGQYGQCERCGHAIEAERLEALPFTSLCIVCAQSKA